MKRRNFLDKLTLGAAVAVAAGCASNPSKTPFSDAESAPRAYSGDGEGLKFLIVSGWQSVNVGDIAHTPGIICAFKKYLPKAKIALWKASYDPKVDDMIRRHFPDVEIFHWKIARNGRVDADAAREMRGFDLMIHGSGPALVARRHLAAWSFATQKPYGVFGITIHDFTKDSATMDSFTKRILQGAAFVYTRETKSLEILKKAGVDKPECSFVPDATFAMTIRDASAADAVISSLGLRERKFMCVVPRLRFTPYWESKKTSIPQSEIDRRIAVNNKYKEVDHAKLREVIIYYVRTTGGKVVLCPEMTYQMGIMDELLFNPLPSDVKKNVVKRGFWLPDEAASFYSKAQCVVSLECHSPIIALRNGTPAFYVRQPEDTVKGQMYYDLGFNDWVFQIDTITSAEITSALSEIIKNPAGAEKYRADGITRAETLFAKHTRRCPSFL